MARQSEIECDGCVGSYWVKNDAVIVPCKLKGTALGWGIAKCLPEEGYIKPPDYIEDAIQKKQQ